MNAYGGAGYFGRTAAAGTKIRVLLLPHPSGVTRATKIVYATQGTAHALTFLVPIGKTQASTGAAAGGNSFALLADPGPSGNALAAGDLVAIRETDNVTRLYVVSSYTAGTLTITGTFTAGVAAGTRVWNFGVEADTHPVTGSPHETYTVPVSTTETFEDREAGVLAGYEVDQPVLLSSANGTAAGTFKQVSYAFTPA